MLKQKPVHTETKKNPWLSAPFLISLSLLLLNDHVLKAAYGNWLTGKLSDFAGIFMVSVLLFAWKPQHKDLTGWLFALFFIAWKSPLASPVIALFNDVMPFGISRVIDYTDCVALVMIPLAAWFVRIGNHRNTLSELTQKWFKIPALMLATFAIIATPGPKPVSISESFRIQQINQKPNLTDAQIKEAIETATNRHEMTACTDTTKAPQAHLPVIACFQKGNLFLQYGIDKYRRVNITTNFTDRSLDDRDDDEIAEAKLELLKLREDLVSSFWQFKNMELVFTIS